MLRSWICLISAIIIAGTSLGFMFKAENKAMLPPDAEYYTPAKIAYWMLFAAGCSFVIGLSFLVLAGMKSLEISAKARDEKTSAPPDKR